MGHTRQQKRFAPRARKPNSDEGIDFVRCRICGDHRRIISGRHLSKHGTDRETYMEEYGLSPDELIAKDSRRLHSSRRDYRPYSKRDWIAAIKKVYKRNEHVFAGFLQEKHQQLYHQGTWLFGDWDKALHAAGFDPEQMRLRSFWNGEKVILGIRVLRKRNLPLYAKYVMKNHPNLFSGALRQYGSWNKALIAGAAGLKLFCAFPLRWNGLCPFVWPQIILETVSMIGGGLLRADKYHTRKVCQAVIFRLRNCTTLQSNFTEFSRRRIQFNLTANRLSSGTLPRSGAFPGTNC